jgi:hypothetical protein
MDRGIIRQKITEVAMIDLCEVSNADLDRLEEFFWAGYNLPMPGWVFHMLQTTTVEERIYKLGQMTRRVCLQRTLSVGRSKILPG